MITQVIRTLPWLAALCCCVFALTAGCTRKADPATPRNDSNPQEPTDLAERDLAHVIIVGKVSMVQLGSDASGKKPENFISVGSPKTSFENIDFSEQLTTQEQASQLSKAEAVVADVRITSRNGLIKFAGSVRVRTEADPPFGTVVVEGEATRAELVQGVGKQTVLAVKNGKLPILVTGKLGVEEAQRTGPVRVTGTLSTGKNGELLLSPEKIEQVKK